MIDLNEVTALIQFGSPQKSAIGRHFMMIRASHRFFSGFKSHAPKFQSSFYFV